jgi:hypothetical protein
MAVPVNTGDSNTRGVLQGVAAGTYEIEFISWERVGAAFYEVYAVEGAFQDDADTDQWQLIGAPGGLEIVAAGPKLTALGLTKAGNQVTIDFVSPTPDGQHQLLESTDLKAWTPITTAVFTKMANNIVRISLSGVAGNARFYRVVLPG